MLVYKTILCTLQTTPAHSSLGIVICCSVLTLTVEETIAQRSQGSSRIPYSMCAADLGSCSSSGQVRDGTTSPLLQREGQEQLEHRQILWNLMGLTWKMPCMIRKKAKYRRRRRLVREGSRRYLGRRGIQT
eukprot:XP_017451639.1 PREDICTED: uncharacterized protein LOC102557427 isoform X1 [Rattus norvegicus]